MFKQSYMYLAKRYEENGLSIYQSLFRRLIEDNNSDYAENIKNAIIDAKKISIGQLDIFSLKNEYFHLVSFLLENKKNFLADLNIDFIDKTTYTELVDLLENAPVI